MIHAIFKFGRLSKLRSRIGNSGIAALEFALAAPVFISLFLGVSDLAPTLMAKFKVGTATQAVADLATQAATMQVADIVNYFAIGSDVMAPFSGTPLVLRITNVASDGNGNAVVYWSCAQGSMQPLPARVAVTTTPTGTPLSKLLTLTKIGLNTSYVMVEAQYTYTAPAGFLFRTPQVTTVVAYTMPRVSTYIAPTNGDPFYTPTPPASTTYTFPIYFSGILCNIAV